MPQSTKERGANAVIWAAWGLLRPSWAELLAGKELEALWMLMLALTKRVEINLMINTVGALESTFTSRNAGLFRSSLLRVIAINACGSAVDMVYSHLESRLTWKWKRKLTQLLHEKYFDDKAFYLIGPGGGPDGMADPDARITSDVEATVGGFSTTFSKVLRLVTQGVLFMYKLYTMYGWQAPISIFAYLAGSTYLVEVIFPVFATWRTCQKKMAESFGSYRSAMTRLGEKAEAVATLQGAQREIAIVRSKFAAHMDDCVSMHWAYFKGGCVDRFFRFFMIQQFQNLFCFGQPIWRTERHGPITAIAEMANVRASISQQYYLFGNCTDAARQAIDLLVDLRRIVGGIERVVELADKLDASTSRRRDEVARTFLQDAKICFSNVEIRTPRGVPLVQDLTFEVKEGGQSLLIVGHNGAGKSSIFRCLSSLWSVPSGGIITRPDLKQCFYIPQKPYQVLGTLQEQMTYPDISNGNKQLSKARLIELLTEVDLQYLVERKGALTEAINWDSELSLGEKQRFAIARLLHHKPKYAILDECSSAISAEMERRLYRICMEQNITYISIAHRPALRAFHDRMLAIGDGQLGWTMTELQRSSYLEQVLTNAKASVINEDTAASMAHHQEERSSTYSDLRNKRVMPKYTTFSRLGRLLTIGRSKDPGMLTLRVTAMISSILVQVWTNDASARNYGTMVACLMRLDKQAFIRAMGWSFTLATIETFWWEVMWGMMREVGRHLGKNIQADLISRVSKDNMFYTLGSLDGRITDLDGRITDDVSGVCGGYGVGSGGQGLGPLVYAGIQPLVRLCWFTLRLGAYVGWKWPVALALYFFGSLGITRMLWRDLQWLSQEASRLDSMFKRIHARVRMHAESIAFYGGGSAERQFAERQFEQVLAHERRVQWMKFKLGWAQQIADARIPEILKNSLRFYFGLYFGGTDADILMDQGQSLNAAQQFLVTAQETIFQNLGRLISLPSTFYNIAGKVQRIAELHEIIDELEADARRITAASTIRSTAASGSREIKSNSTTAAVVDVQEGNGASSPVEPLCISFEGVDIVSPGGDCFAADVSFSVSHGACAGMMVTGRSAAGKTSLVRVLSGLWPTRKGRVCRPTGGPDGQPALHEVFVVPQSIHMVIGTLCDQITYPHRLEPQERTSEVEDKLRGLLQKVGGDDDDLADLRDADASAELGLLGTGHERGEATKESWDKEVEWEHVLSLGEQQRLGLARMYYHSPRFAVLDECTSAVSIDAEEVLYAEAVQLGVTTITISQRNTLPEFHTQQLSLGEDVRNGWSLKDIEAGQKNVVASAV